MHNKIYIMELKSNQIIELRNGLFGVVASFNDKPFQLIFRSYTNPISRYDKDLKNKNTAYDIVRIYSGKNIENVTDVFSTKFNADDLDLIWERTND